MASNIDTEGAEIDLSQSTLEDLGVPVVEKSKKDLRVAARELVQKVRAMVQAAGKMKANEKEVVSSHLDELYELFVQQALELASAKTNMENMALKIAENESEKRTYAAAAQRAAASVQKADGETSRRPTGQKGKIRTAGPTTDHVLFIHSVDKAEDVRSLDKRVTKEIDPKALKVDVSGKKPMSSGGLLVRLSSKQDVETLEKAIRENERLKETVKCSAPKLRSPRIIVYDIPTDIEGTDVIGAAVEQAGLKEGSVSIKFPIKGKDLNHWVLECNSESFVALIKLRRLTLGWTKAKISEHLRPTQCFKCGQYGHISKVCPNKEVCLECGTPRKDNEKKCKNPHCGEKRCLNCKLVNKQFPAEQRVKINHSALNPQCPTRALEKSRMRKRTDYG